LKVQKENKLCINKMDVKMNRKKIFKKVNDFYFSSLFRYAYLMENAALQYKIARECKLTEIGGALDNKVSIVYCYNFNTVDSRYSEYSI